MKFQLRSSHTSIVPAKLRKEMMERVHSSHLGFEGCFRRAREVFYWPRMNAKFKDFILNCDICNLYKPAQPREPLMHHEIPSRPCRKRLAQICSCLISATTWLLLIILLLPSRWISLTWQIPELLLRWEVENAVQPARNSWNSLTMDHNLILQSLQSLQVTGTFNISLPLHGIPKVMERLRVL